MRCNSEVAKMRSEVQSNLSVAMDFEMPVEARVAATRRLGELGDQDVVVPLGVLLGQTDSELRDTVAITLKRLDATEMIKRDLKSAMPPRRIRATQLLALICDEGSVSALIDALEDPCAKVRESAASALYSFRDGRAIPGLARVMIEDSDADVRGAAAQALGEIPAFTALDALEQAARLEKDAFTRVLITRSITRWRANSSVADLLL
jgi:HEAT repeat protein